jgi:single-stranded DNA-specific DHH superfamily exonuclease
MEIAVIRIEKALGDKERILIYGDYDVDGTTAVSLFISSCERLQTILIITFLTGTMKGMAYRFKNRFMQSRRA